MYADKLLEFERADRDTPGLVTRAIALGSADFTGTNAPDTAGMGPYGGLWLVVLAASDIPAGFTVKIEQSDTESGTYTTLLTSAATAAAAKPGVTLCKIPLPFAAKNWLKLTKSAANAVNAFLTNDVDKWPAGMCDG